MRLGLIAMSGVRVQNRELLAMGLNLPGFVERSQVIASLPSLGLLTLAGLTPRGIDLEYLEVADVRDVTDLPTQFDVVAISSFSAQIFEAYELADRFRALGTKVVLGGLHVSACPAEAACHADAIVIGEGEPVWETLLRDLERNALQKVYDARGTSFDLAQAPIPRFDLLEIPRYNRLTVQTQRGCPFKCEFCAASIRISPKFKTKPIAKVIEEIRAIKQLWKNPFIEFADDNSFANKHHGRELVRALIPENIRWFTETDISVAEDPELLDLMRESGCAQILVGLESPQSGPLNGIEQAANWKFRQGDRYLRAIDAIQNRGITVNGCFILGLDGADTGSFDAVWDFVRTSELYEVQITVMTPFAGTPLYDRLDREGRLLRPGQWDHCTLFDVMFQPDSMSVGELESGLRELGKKVYSREFTDHRRAQFMERQRRMRRIQRQSSR